MGSGARSPAAEIQERDLSHLRLTEAEAARLPRGDKLIAEYRARFGDRTLLPFSCGKDSIATALAIRDKLDVIPLYYELVPGLEFIEESLDYYERRLFHRHIHRLPAPHIYRILNNGTFLPNSCSLIVDAAKLPDLDYPDVNRMAVRAEGLSGKVMAAVGVRMDDSQLRRVSFFKYGAIRESRNSWFPIWDWSKDRLIHEIDRSGLSLPIDYLIWGRSFDGLQYTYLVGLKKHLPRDYAKVKELFPLIDVELVRYELHQGNKALTAEANAAARRHPSPSAAGIHPRAAEPAARRVAN